MGFVSLKYDFSFKNLMRNETVRRYFISDVLGISPEEIRSVRLANTFLWKRYFRQKLGILDVLLILNDESKINIELQIKIVKYWDRRILFYLAKMFTEDLLAGEKYGKLRKCISISILDFKVDNSAEYHRIYRLRDKAGNEFSEMFEVHILELCKKLDGEGPMDDWIRLINAETEEEIDMIKTDNPGILTAIREIKLMNFGKGFRAMYEAHMKEVRDRNARDEYVWDEGNAAGRTEGEVEKLISIVRKMSVKNMSAKVIAEMLGEEEALVTEICSLHYRYPDWETDRIYRELKEKYNK